ncbi:IMP-specific 5-nucleotidase [Pelagophyceae sp. CCMP2097]|nr:IMP-specific 5-nucleotidase [Pelagophyceae sp. CCMP2097]
MDAACASSRRRNYYLVSHRRDQFIEFVKGLLQHSFVLDALEATAESSWAYVEELIEEHRLEPRGSRLATAVPTVGTFFTRLPLAEAWLLYDAKNHISKRRFVSPSFNEIREILNMSQILAFRAPGAAGEFAADGAENVKTSTLDFVSFDGDCTLYSDGKNFQDAELGFQIVRLLRSGVVVALVTAAGYGYDATRYERRLEGLLAALASEPAEVVQRFFVVGGECNYLLQLERRGNGVALASREEVWDAAISQLHTFSESAVEQLLDVAEASLRESVADFALAGARVIRKPRAVGLVPDGNDGAGRETLDECVLRVQDALRGARPGIPFCAFNGGSDVWVDIGNKKVGVVGVQAICGLDQHACLHIGDQFLNTGNDFAARGSCACLWITQPKETKLVLDQLLAVVDPQGTSNSDAKPPVRTFWD